MTTFFVGCFAFGLLFTVTTFLLGAFGGTEVHVGDHFLGNLTGTHTSTDGHASAGEHVSPFSLSTLSAFLTWFGGAGYLLTRYSPFSARPCW